MCASRPLVFCLLFLTASYGPAFSKTAEPKSAADWFLRATELMSLRTLNAAPFHLQARFTANAGEELLGAKETSHVINGEGTYDEIWMGPHEWRREVTLGNYHALEIDANGVRKFHASSDYEPGRIAMLLDALYAPIPRLLTSKEFRADSGWKMDHVNSGGLSLVRLSKIAGSQRAEFTDSFYFLPSSGVLALSNFQGLVNVWSADATFDGKVFPRQFTIQSGNKAILSAHISVDPAGKVDASTFAMEGGPADPGMTLRPLHPSEARMPDLSGSFNRVVQGLDRPPMFSMMGTLDRHGRFRELEILSVENPKSAKAIMDYFRDLHTSPPTIDGSPCQVRVFWQTM